MRCAHPVAGPACGRGLKAAQPRLRQGLRAARPACGQGYKATGDALLRTPRGLFVFYLLRFGPCRGFFWRKR